MNKNTYAVIMAGGIGARFWPLSRLERPKQFLSVFGENTLIDDTVNRIKSRFAPDNILIITNHLHEQRTRELFPWIPARNIIGEPIGRNTTACVALATQILLKRDPESRMVVMPADHYIGDDEEFLCTLERAAHGCTGGYLLTLGMSPNSPETGYGYIQHHSEEISPGLFSVRTFAEKPNFKTAMRFLKSGDFLWNSGMFIWETQAIADALIRWQPDIWESLSEMQPFLDTSSFYEQLQLIYPQLRSVSIDFGVMEAASRQAGLVRVIKAVFPWNDVGTWTEVHKMGKKDDDGNSIKGEAVIVNSSNCLIHSLDKTVALVGMQDTIIVDSPDALLICNMSEHQNVKLVINRLKEDGLHELL
jgi:mannose-1-phosphate guanylyltransferase